MGLRAKAPLIAFLGLMYSRSLLPFVLGRAGAPNDGGIDQGALSHHDACFRPASDMSSETTGGPVDAAPAGMETR